VDLRAGRAYGKLEENQILWEQDAVVSMGDHTFPTIFARPFDLATPPIETSGSRWMRLASRPAQRV